MTGIFHCAITAPSIQRERERERERQAGRQAGRQTTRQNDRQDYQNSKLLYYVIREIKYVAEHIPHHSIQQHILHILKFKQQLL